MKVRDWIFLYLPPLFLLLLGGVRFFAIPAAVLLMAIATHVYLHHLARQRIRLKRAFHREKTVECRPLR